VQSGYAVFSIDCRGYGDSTGSSTEHGVVTDVLKLYDLIKSHNQKAKIAFYGHSLGSAYLFILGSLFLLK
jgi:alpha-beta hydrolase superfamily lysophospholipase